jgi:uncharacterized protein (DUF983 family)
MEIKKHRNNYLWTIVNNRCPHCREGNMFLGKSAYTRKGSMDMYEHCPVCGQAMEIEDGFYVGTGYVSYALAVAFSVSTFVAWWVLVGMSVDDNRVFWWLGINAVLLLLVQPYFMRLSRSIWLSFFVKYDPDFKIAKPLGSR